MLFFGLLADAVHLAIAGGNTQPQKFISLFCTLISYTESRELRTRNGIVRIYDLQVIEPFGKSPKIFFLTRASREVHL